MARCRDPLTTTGSASESGGARYTARTGTACSTTTMFGAAGSPTPLRRRAGTDSPSPTTSTSSARRDAQLDLMADLMAAHADIDAILGLLEGGPPERPAIVSALRG